jgi:hypothetical protein
VHLASVFGYSVLFAPFNTLTTEQMMRLEMTVKQRIEMFLFCIGSGAALFLFGVKRPNKVMPVSPHKRPPRERSKRQGKASGSGAPRADANKEGASERVNDRS